MEIAMFSIFLLDKFSGINLILYLLIQEILMNYFLDKKVTIWQQKNSGKIKLIGLFLPMLKIKNQNIKIALDQAINSKTSLIKWILGNKCVQKIPSIS